MRQNIALVLLGLLILPSSVLGGSIQASDSVLARREGWLNGSTAFTVRYFDPDLGKTKFRTAIGAIQYRNVGGAGDGELIPQGLVGAFCIDLRDPLVPFKPPGQSEPIAQFQVQSSIAPNGRLLSQEKQLLIRRLFGKFSELVDPQSNVLPPPGISKRQATMAFSLAVWEIVYEKAGRETDVRTGSGFRALAFTKEKKKIAATANDYLAAIRSPSAPEGAVRALVPFDPTGRSPFQDRYQDLIVAAVPGPGTVVMLAGLGAMGAVALARRRWKRAWAR